MNTRAQQAGVYLFVIASACAYYLVNAPALLGHFDLGWHLAAGDLIRRQGSLPLHDPWAFTSAGKPWLNLSWLWDALASVIYQHTGFAGLVVLTVGFGAAIAGCLTGMALKTGSAAVPVCVAVLASCLLYPSFASFPNIYLAAAPNMATMLFTLVFLAACLAPSRLLLLLPLVMLLWVNLHGGFMQGLALIGYFGITSLLRRHTRTFFLFAITEGLCLAATLVNPLGWHIYQGVAATLGNPVQGQIGEWMPYFHNFIWPGSLVGLCYILFFVITDLRYRTSCPLELRILTWLFLCAGFTQFRYMAFFFLFSAIPLALHLDRMLKVRGDVGKALAVAGAAMACTLPVIYFLMRPSFGLPQMVSQADAHYLRDHFPHARMLNNWNFGGLLIFYDRGSVPLFVDGRAATAYPDSLLRDWYKVGKPEVVPADWDMVLRKYRIDTVLWVKTHAALRQYLVGTRGWKQVYAGQYVSIYVRPKP